MKISSSKAKIKILFTGIILGIAYLCISRPGEVVVKDSGKVDGVINHARKMFQGKRFWKNQLIEIDKELKWELGEPKRKAEFDRELRLMDREFENEDKEFYREYPDMRPSAAERQAEALRERADAIEQAELDRELEKFRLQRIAELRRVRPVVQLKAK